MSAGFETMVSLLDSEIKPQPFLFETGEEIKP